VASSLDTVETAGSNVVTGTGTNSVRFTLPGSPQYIVQSVVATVDNAGGADTTATLTYADTNGEVIAKKPQNGTIPAGDTGTATFALRLSDEASSTAAGIRFDKTPQEGGFLEATTLGPASPSGWSIALNTETGGAILLNAPGPGGEIRLTAPFYEYLGQGGSVQWSNVDQFDVQGTDFSFTGHDFTADASHDVTLTAATQVDLDAALITLEGGNTEVLLAVGKTLTVKNHLGAAIFRVNENGDLQGLTGKALVFNL
jgi:hypothetical protein